MPELGVVRVLHEALEVEPARTAGLGLAIGLETREIADRRIEPDVEELAEVTWDLEAEVGRIARDVPVLEAGAQPFAKLGLDAACDLRSAEPLLDEALKLGCGKPEEVMLGLAQYRRGAGDDGARVLKLGRRIGRAAVLAVVAVLVRGAALRTFALDVALGQEHLLHRIEGLLDLARGDQALAVQRPVDRFRQRAVFGRMRRVVMIEADAEGLEVGLVAALDVGDEGLRRQPSLLRRQHDRRAVRVVRTDIRHVRTAHALEPHPDIGLHVADHVAEVQRAVRVGQGVGDE